MTSLFNDILNALNQIVLEVVDKDEGKVKLLKGECDWSESLFPLSKTHQPFTITIDTPFLYDFLIDARQVWAEKNNAQLRSGFWTEITSNERELHLEAIAIHHTGRNLLVIVNQFEDFKIHQRTKQMAREVLLSNDLLYLQNEYLHTRLLAILQKPAEENNILRSLTKVISNASFAILISDNNFSTVIQNTAALNIFDQTSPATTNTPKPIDIITKLMKNQLPEYERIITTNSSWDGELCWMCPPSTLKWLKISLYPVKNAFNEVENWIFFINDISHIKHLSQRNELLSLIDVLTELPNRLSFWRTLEKQINSNTPFYLLYVDINDFRRHNEFYGHSEGDKLLTEFGRRIKQVLKKSDFIARVGGDEFAIILTEINERTSCEVAIKRILDQVNLPFRTLKHESFNISISIGAASFPNDAVSPEELMRFVDLSAYNGKKNKRNSLQFYSKSMKDASLNIIKVEQELREAIKNEEFELYLQPIFDIKSNTFNKAEALIRWNHPKHGVVKPNDFIPIAEKSPLINAIGEWVISRTCQIAKEMDALGHPLIISMNLSAHQVVDRNLFNYIYKCVSKYNVNPKLLGVEVTEGVLVDDYSITKKLLDKLRGLGISVSVDDFGTGYSSLSYLKKLPLDFLKIDRSFVQDIVIDDNDKAIVKAVIAMAHNLNLSVITEGVETEEQLNFLVEHACDSIQGYLFSHPVKLNQFIKLLPQ